LLYAVLDIKITHNLCSGPSTERLISSGRIFPPLERDLDTSQQQ